MGKSKPQVSNLNLPKLPPSKNQNNNNNNNNASSFTTIIDAGIMLPDQFTRKNLKSILHIITQQLKKRGTKTPHIFLPFRSKINDEKLELFLSSICPQGELRQDEALLLQICSKTDEFTLICALKFFWSRLPNNEVIGWDIYLEFKRREAEKGFPKNSFLTIMPKCLSSPAHASIVYDFLDLILSITSNSQFNYLSGRKISKMASFWAFSSNQQFLQSPFFDATKENEYNFIEGVDSWKKSTNALFHLVLAFLRSMLPETNSETLKIPKTLQSLLVTTQYPPSSECDSDRGYLKHMITIPCVCVTTTQPSKNPYELISKVRHTLKFDKKDDFLSIENYTILKNLFSKKGTFDIVNSLTDESKRILSRISAEPIISKFNLVPGWSQSKIPVDSDIPLFSEISIKDVTIQDYFIWAWLSSISSDQPSATKSIFGRSIVVEAEVLGFQKWIVLTEKTLSSEDYLQKFNLDKRMLSKSHKRQISMEDYKDVPLPPLPGNDTKSTQQHQSTSSSSSSSSSMSSSSGKESFQSKDSKKHDSDLTTTSDSKTHPTPPYSSRDSEAFDRSFSDEFSYIYPTSVNTELLQEHEQYMASSKELHSEASRFLKTTTDDIYLPLKHQVGRKAPPPATSLDPFTPRSQDSLSNRQSSTPDNTFSPSKSDNNTIDTLKEDKYYEPFDVYHPELQKPSSEANSSLEPYDNYYVDVGAPTLQPPASGNLRKSPPLQRLNNELLDPAGDTTIAVDRNMVTSSTPEPVVEHEQEENDEEEECDEEESCEETDAEEIQRRKEEKKRKKKEKKKLAKQAEAAQLAAAQAAGFPFALLPSNIPPPQIPGMPEPEKTTTATPKKEKKNKQDSLTPKKKKESSATATPKKVKRAPVDQTKPLPDPSDSPTNMDKTSSSTSAASTASPMSVPSLAPPKAANISNSPNMGFVSSPKFAPAPIGNDDVPANEILVAPKEQYNLFISQHPPSQPQSPAHPYFMQDEKRPTGKSPDTSLSEVSPAPSATAHKTTRKPPPSSTPVVKSTSQTQPEPQPQPQPQSQPQSQPQPPAPIPQPTVFNATPPMGHAQLAPVAPQQPGVHNATPPMNPPPPQQQQPHMMRPGYYQQPANYPPQQQPQQQQYIPRPQYQQPQPMGYTGYQQPQMHPYQPPQQQQQQQSPMGYVGYQQPQPMGYPQYYTPNGMAPPMQYQGPPQGHHQPHPPHQHHQQQPMMMGPRGKSQPMMNMVPMGAKHNKNQVTNKANLRAAFVQGSFGI
ncbi:hypothetical protein G210_3014 [Candida maltosa Xu316]|uniref:Meiotically up-regulated protein Msb1/Mug8 domain-containing protein n=1 Tax=Candida maltosa (strain Xu316) TaxID=1245528 RepID=M3J443_CANMX|nr:hypothetical protein G210_3014 [Candida maltosa Xu316]